MSDPPVTEAKKLPSVTLSPPRTPDLSNTLMRPLAAARICVGPTSPTLSGGMNWDSCGASSEIALKLIPTVWGASGVRSPDAGAVAWSGATVPGFGGGHCDTGGAAGFSLIGPGRPIGSSLRRGKALIFGALASRSMMSATDSRTPAPPVQGTPTVSPGSTRDCAEGSSWATDDPSATDATRTPPRMKRSRGEGMILESYDETHHPAMSISGQGRVGSPLDP